MSNEEESPRKRQEFEHSFKRFHKIDHRRELEEDQDWKRDLEEELIGDEKPDPTEEK